MRQIEEELKEVLKQSTNLKPPKSGTNPNTAEKTASPAAFRPLTRYPR